jgi:hypothetical protein
MRSDFFRPTVKLVRQQLEPSSNSLRPWIAKRSKGGSFGLTPVHLFKKYTREASAAAFGSLFNGIIEI